VCGATGSYIFSQTIFSAKRSVKSRFNGFVVAIGEFLLFGLPVDILKVLPNAAW
jgi:SulP family sulfate permease